MVNFEYLHADDTDISMVDESLSCVTCVLLVILVVIIIIIIIQVI